MTYQLVQPASLPVIIKDRAWFLCRVKELMGAEAQHTSGPRRSFYLFEPQYATAYKQHTHMYY